MPRTNIAVVVMSGLNVENLSGQSHHTFVQISLAQDTSWAETHLSGGGLGLRLGEGASAPPPSPGLATSLVATLSGNSLRQTVYTHRASVHQAAKLVAALLMVARVTAGLAYSNNSLLPGL